MLIEHEDILVCLYVIKLGRFNRGPDTLHSVDWPPVDVTRKTLTLLTNSYLLWTFLETFHEALHATDYHRQGSGIAKVI